MAKWGDADDLPRTGRTDAESELWAVLGQLQDRLDIGIEVNPVGLLLPAVQKATSAPQGFFKIDGDISAEDLARISEALADIEGLTIEVLNPDGSAAADKASPILIFVKYGEGPAQPEDSAWDPIATTATPRDDTVL